MPNGAEVVWDIEKGGTAVAGATQAFVLARYRPPFAILLSNISSFTSFRVMELVTATDCR